MLFGACFLIALSVVAGWPVLMGGGLWYLDNPAHLAETLELAKPGGCGWSDLAFCGFPLGQWHSPVAYGVLAGLVQRGMPLDVVYVGALWASYLFPSLVLFAGARQRLGAGRAVLLASILLLQPPALVGIESAWGGMWTFYLAAGGLLWLMQRWSSGHGGLAGDAALIGAIGLTHLFVFAVVPLLAGLRILLSFRRPSAADRSAARIVAACFFGALASAAFWLPAWLAQAGSHWTSQNLSPGRLLWALAVPADLQILTSAAPVAWKECWQPGVFPMLALLGLGIAGGLRRNNSADSRPGRFGLAFALAVLAVLFVLPFLPQGSDRLWGPVSWRLLYMVRLGLAWSALEALATCASSARVTKFGWHWMSAGLLLVALGWWIAAPLRQAVRDPGQQTQRQVQNLWAAIRAGSIPGEAGQIYLQDTYQNPAIPAGLARNSHVLALTAAETGTRQLGAFYGMAPQATAEWTAGEFGRLCGVASDDPDAFPRVVERLRRGNCTRLVVASPVWTALFAGKDGFTREYQSDWFTLFRIAQPETFGAEIISGAGLASVEFPHLGEAILDVTSSAPSGAVRISQAWHPNWKLVGNAAGAHLDSDETGLLCVDNLQAGHQAVRLRYQPPAWPQWISWCAWIGLLGSMIGLPLWNRRGRTRPSFP